MKKTVLSPLSPKAEPEQIKKSIGEGVSKNLHNFLKNLKIDIVTEEIKQLIEVSLPEDEKSGDENKHYNATILVNDELEALIGEKIQERCDGEGRSGLLLVLYNLIRAQKNAIINKKSSLDKMRERLYSVINLKTKKSIDELTYADFFAEEIELNKVAKHILNATEKEKWDASWHSYKDRIPGLKNIKIGSEQLKRLILASSEGILTELETAYADLKNKTDVGEIFKGLQLVFQNSQEHLKEIELLYNDISVQKEILTNLIGSQIQEINQTPIPFSFKEETKKALIQNLEKNPKSGTNLNRKSITLVVSLVLSAVLYFSSPGTKKDGNADSGDKPKTEEGLEATKRILRESDGKNNINEENKESGPVRKNTFEAQKASERLDHLYGKIAIPLKVHLNQCFVDKGDYFEFSMPENINHYINDKGENILRKAGITYEEYMRGMILTIALKNRDFGLKGKRVEKIDLKDKIFIFVFGHELQKRITSYNEKTGFDLLDHNFRTTAKEFERYGLDREYIWPLTLSVTRKN